MYNFTFIHLVNAFTQRVFVIAIIKQHSFCFLVLLQERYIITTFFYIIVQKVKKKVRKGFIALRLFHLLSLRETLYN